jgi:hypothetical protein
VGRAPGTIIVEAWCDADDLPVRVGDGGRGLVPHVDSPGLGVGISLLASLVDDFTLANRDGMPGAIVSLPLVSRPIRSRVSSARDPRRQPRRPPARERERAAARAPAPGHRPTLRQGSYSDRNRSGRCCLVAVVAGQSRAAHAERGRDGLAGYADLGRARNQSPEFGVTTHSQCLQLTEESRGHTEPIGVPYQTLSPSGRKLGPTPTSSNTRRTALVISVPTVSREPSRRERSGANIRSRVPVCR